MDIQTMVLCGCVVFVATFIHRLSGFGMGIVNVMLLPYLLSSHAAAATLSNSIAFVTAVYMTAKYWKDVKWKIVVPTLISSFLIGTVCVRLAVSASFEILEKLLGITLILLAAYFIGCKKQIQIEGNARNGMIAGLCCGVLNSFFGVGGPPIAIYLANATSNYATYFATIQFYYALDTTGSLLIRAYNGLFTPDVLYGFLSGLVGMVLANFLGGKLAGKVPEEHFRKIVYGVMLVSGVLMLF